MIAAVLCLSIALQPMATNAEPWVLDAEELSALLRTLDDVGDFQQPYAALVDVAIPEEGSVDASVEVSAARFDDGTPVVVLDDDGAQDSTRFVVLRAEWQGLPAGTLLHGIGPTLAVVTHAEDDAAGARAQVMLGFLDLLMAGPIQLHPSDLDWNANLGTDDLAGFLDTFAASTTGEPVDEATRNRWQGRLPDTLLALWKRDGLARYLEDRLILVDPERYAAVLAGLLVGSTLEDVDAFHVYALTAFGQLLVCGENTAVEIVADPYTGDVAADPSMLAASDADERDGRLRFLLTLLEPDELDVTDAKGNSVYARTRDRLGALEGDDVYFPDPEGLVDGWELRLIKQDALKAWHSPLRRDVH